MSSTVSKFKMEQGISLETLQWERAMTRESRVFSRIAVGLSTYHGELREPLVLLQASPISIQGARESWGWLLSHCRANRPHLGLCRDTPCSSPVVTEISGFTQGVRPSLELKQRIPLSSLVAKSIS